MVILMGGFHELCVRQKTIYKTYTLSGYQKWVIDAKTIASGSSDVVVEGRHYYRNTRINKEIFYALVQYTVEELTNYYNDMDIFISLFINLRGKPNPENLDLILTYNEFQHLFRKILNDSHGTESKMTILEMVSTVTEKNFKRLKCCITFAHIKYSRYLTY